MFLLKNSENTQMFLMKISENTKMFVFIETVQLSVQAHQISLLRTPPSPSENSEFQFFNFQFISIITYMRVRTT